MPWLQAQVRTRRDRTEAAEALLETLGALSVTLEDAADQPLLEPGPGDTPLWDATLVTGLFAATTDTEALHDALVLGLDDPSASIGITPLEDQPWERAWLDHFKPMRFGRRLWICPHGQSLLDAGTDAVVLHLDPGLAFGTGTHPTTALCLEWLEGADLKGKTLIDYGCGSGVLGIAALLLGAANVIAIDHDPQALMATAANARQNGVDDRLATYTSGEAPPIAADILVANILAGVLIALAPTLTAGVSPSGRLVLSGILETQVAEVQQAYAPGFSFAPTESKDGWTLLTACKN